MKRNLTAGFLILVLLLGGCAAASPEPTQWPQDKPLTVHFIDEEVGNSALLECGGDYMLICGGADGLRAASCLEALGVEELAAVVLTGEGAGVLENYPASAVYAPAKTGPSLQDVEITVPEPGHQFWLGGTKVTFLGPIQPAPEADGTAIVLRAEYGENSFLFAGDMGEAALNDLLDYWNGDLQADVLNLSGNTSDGRLLEAAAPDCVILSGTSATEEAGVTVYRTDELGTIAAKADGEEILFSWSLQSSSSAVSTAG